MMVSQVRHLYFSTGVGPADREMITHIIIHHHVVEPDDSVKDVVVVEEEKEEVTSRDLDLPPEPDNDEYHDTVEGKERKANFVLAFWQLFMTVFFYHFLEGNEKKITNEPSRNKSEETKKEV